MNLLVALPVLLLNNVQVVDGHDDHSTLLDCHGATDLCFYPIRVNAKNPCLLHFGYMILDGSTCFGEVDRDLNVPSLAQMFDHAIKFLPINVWTLPAERFYLVTQIHGLHLYLKRTSQSSHYSTPVDTVAFPLSLHTPTIRCVNRTRK